MTGRMISLGNGGAGLSLKALRRELAALQKRCTQLWAEMAPRSRNTSSERSAGRRHRAFKRYEALRDRYWAVEARRVELRG